MRTFVLSALLAVLAACGGSGRDGGIVNPPPLKPKPDPYLTIRIRNQLDTTTNAGRANWQIYELLTGPYDSQNGVSFEGGIALEDIRLGHAVRCGGLGADSVGQRFVTVLALADTIPGEPSDKGDAIAHAWYNGDHTLPAGWMALTFTPVDAFVSDQYNAGHGLVPTDPIKWGMDWTAGGSVSFYERTDSETTCNTFP